MTETPFQCHKRLNEAQKPKSMFTDAQHAQFANMSDNERKEKLNNIRKLTTHSDRLTRTNAVSAYREFKQKYVSEGVNEATYQGREVTLNKPTKGDVKKSKVYVDPDGDGKAKKVEFGDKTMSIKKNDPDRKRSYCARSKPLGNDKSKANYWSRKAWDC